MKISCRKKIALDSRKDAIVIPVYKNIPSLRTITGKKIDDELRLILDSDYFNYDENEIRSFYVELNRKLKKIYLVNAPKEMEYPEVYRKIGAKLQRIVKEDKLTSFSLIAFEDIYNEKKDYSSTTAFIEGVMFGLYSFNEFKTKKDTEHLTEIEIITNINKLKSYIDSNVPEWDDVFKHVFKARDLINMPAGVLTPKAFAEYIQSNADKSVTVEIMNAKQIKSNGLNMVTAVGIGSSNEPYFVKLTYTGNPESKQNIALVGKGVTFDSGGSNLKPTGSIETMKCDMSGAACMFAVTNLVATRKLKININTYIPLVENIIGGNALRPGDIIKSLSGKTVEVLNTDAEGRLILADALYMSTKTDPDVIIDAATLTGACVVALGDYCAGLFSNRKFLSKQITDISNRVGEDLWELPLYDNYTTFLKSKNADLQNISNGPKNAGAILAALFLKEFVDNYPWIHMDIAGPAFLSGTHPVFGTQATGFGVRLIYTFLKTHYL